MTKMSISGVFKFILGFALAIALLFLAGAGLTRYLLSRLTTPPPRPTFTNDPAPPSPANSPGSSPTTSPAASPSAAAPEAVNSASPAASPTPSPQGYQARVTQPIGLILRQEPSVEAARVGGIEFNEEVVVLEDSPDGGWQKVRSASGAVGWVKGSNTTPIN